MAIDELHCAVAARPSGHSAVCAKATAALKRQAMGDSKRTMRVLLDS
jgi:hypothetical protein